MNNKSVTNTAAVQAEVQKEKRESFLNILMRGAQKGLKIWFNNIIPSVVLTGLFLAVVEVTGLLDLIGNVMGPFMSIFGLPGEAIVPWAMGWLNMAASIMAAVPLLEAGTLTGTHAAILLAMIMGSTAIDKMFRLASTSGADGKTTLQCVGLTVLCSILCGLVMRILMLFL